MDLRGTGGSATPADPASYRCRDQVDDVDALRRHLGLERLDLAARSAGAAVALLYAARHPDRVGRLALLASSPRVVDLDVTGRWDDVARAQVAGDAALFPHGRLVVQPRAGHCPWLDDPGAFTTTMAAFLA